LLGLLLGKHHGLQRHPFRVSPLKKPPAAACADSLELESEKSQAVSPMGSPPGR
jgi:hypothetical protein